MVIIWSMSWMTNPTTDTTIPKTIANQVMMKTYWYKTCCDISHTNLCLLFKTFLMSRAASCTSHRPKLGSSTLPGFGEPLWPKEEHENAYRNNQHLSTYFQVTDRRGGDVYQFFEIFPTPPELIRTPRLLIFKKKNSVQDVFTPGLLYFQFFPSKNAYLTPIWSIFT